MENFFNFIKLRHSIYIDKEIKKLKGPWTDDPILQKYKFCNIYRELDTGTKIVQNLNCEDDNELLVNIFCYRIFNKRNHFENIGWISPNNWERQTFKEHLIKCKENGTIFSDAYLTNWNLNNILDGIEYILDIKPNYLELETPKLVFNELLKIKNVGPFLGYQLYLDLSYFNGRFHNFTENDFVIIGPGSIGGLKILFPDHELSKKNCEKLIYEIRDIHQPIYVSEIDNLPPLTLAAIEHALCEYRKYKNLKEGHGKKRIYRCGN